MLILSANDGQYKMLQIVVGSNEVASNLIISRQPSILIRQGIQ